MNEEYFTESDVDITQKIKDGFTKLFKTSELDKAKAYAKQSRSYVYEVFKSSKNNPKVLAGYGVPK